MTDPSGTYFGPETLTTTEEVLRCYAEGKILFESVELPEGSSFRGAKLPGIHFKKAWLSGTDFSNADLRGAIFETANVKCVDFRFADLRGASFRDVVLCGSTFSHANVEDIRVNDSTSYGNPVDPDWLQTLSKRSD